MGNVKINSALIKEAVYRLCFEANTSLNDCVYNKIHASYKKAASEEEKNILSSILNNAKIAKSEKKPLCQDTGQVIVFLEIGQNVIVEGDYIEDVINNAVEKCYKENFFRKSVVKNSVFNRKNTNTNTPAIIYTKLSTGDDIKIKLLIKGGGSENKSTTKMLLPTAGEEEIVTEIGDLILKSGVNACPPMFIGIGIGGTLDKAALLSKEVFFEKIFSKQEKELAEKIENYVNLKSPKPYTTSYVLDIKLKTSPTHIACMPVAVTINCHSDRFSECIINQKGINYNDNIPLYKEIKENNDAKEVNTSDIESIKKLKKGERVLLTGRIYVARDMVHKKLTEMHNAGEKLPIDIKDKIIFYAGPCPGKKGEVIGSIGPTTAGRMDKYALWMYEAGLLATIGKGERSEELIKTIKKNKGKYFTVTGGIAALLSKKVKKCQIIAFKEFGAEALYKLEVEKFPVKVEI